VAYGYHASVSERRKFDLHYDRLGDATQKALQSLGWNHQAVSPYQFNVSFGMSLFSYGENMYISIYNDGIIDISSISKGSNVYFDFGKNRRNIVNFFRQLDKELGLAKEGPAEKKGSKEHGFGRSVLGSKTGEPEDGELIER